jgi:hypothetical protein
MDLGQISQQ